MKKMKQKKVLEQSLCGVLALLGFAACAETSVEYGTPTMDFWVRGKVISDDGKALKDIQVIVKNENAYYNDEEGELVRMNDTIYTDSGGEFVSQMMRDGWVDTKKLIFNDIDGEANEFGGGFIGSVLGKTLHSLLGLTGAYIIAVVLLMISIVILTEKSIMSVIKKNGEKAYKSAKEEANNRRERKQT